MKNLLLLILFICSSSIIKAQDTLITRSSDNANSQDMYIRGYNDAIKYYKSYKVAGNSVLKNFQTDNRDLNDSYINDKTVSLEILKKKDYAVECAKSFLILGPFFMLGLVGVFF